MGISVFRNLGVVSMFAMRMSLEGNKLGKAKWVRTFIYVTYK